MSLFSITNSSEWPIELAVKTRADIYTVVTIGPGKSLDGLNLHAIKLLDPLIRDGALVVSSRSCWLKEGF